MKVLYIGQYSRGTTSRMRALKLKSVLANFQFEVIDINVPYLAGNKLNQSLAFRYKFGPLIRNINEYIIKRLEGKYHLIWVDKGVFISAETIKKIRMLSDLLVHYTPDCAFFQNSSKLFESGIKHYDFVVTTKSFEITNYKQLVDERKIILTTQGFDSSIHFPRHEFEDKKNQVAFVGLHEPSREMLVQSLIGTKINVCLAGKNWHSFVKKNKSNQHLDYKGDGLFADDYSSLISESKFALGAISKRFPELHTTRTFEIPACGTALLTESNPETSTFFDENEAIFYDGEDQIIEKILFFLDDTDSLQRLTKSGFEKVTGANYEYSAILENTLSKIGF